jgi:hypothetical protein
MAIAVDSSLTEQIRSSGSTFSYSFTNTAGNILVVGVWGEFADTIALTYNSVALTRLNWITSNSGTTGFGLYYLMNPATGANNLDSSGMNSGGNFTRFFTASYSGVDTAALDNNGTDAGSASLASPYNVSLTINTANSWMISFFGFGATTTGYTNCTVRSSRLGTTFPLVDSNGALTTGSNSQGITYSGSQSVAACMMSIKPTSTSFTVSVTDSVTTGEVVAKTLVSLISKTDGVTLGEVITQTLVSLVSKTDAVTLGEAVTMQEVSFISKTDAVTIGEAITETVVSFISKTDAVTIGEVVTQTLVSLISKTDSVTIGESVSQTLVNLTSQTDSITTGESLSISSTLGALSITDSITITETISMNEVSFISKTDAVATGEVVTRTLVNLVSKTDSVTTGESLSVVALLGSVSVTDSITVSETRTFMVESYISATDAVTATESFVVSRVSFVSVTDSVSITDSPSVASFLGNIVVTDSLHITETITMRVPAQTSGLAIMRSKSNEWPLAMDEPSSYW